MLMPTLFPSKKIKPTMRLQQRPVSGCGACVAACKNSSAMLFMSAKVAHLAQLPQGHPERKIRVLNMVGQMDKEGFGACTFTGACEAVCPKEIAITNISRLNKEYLNAGLSVE